MHRIAFNALLALPLTCALLVMAAPAAAQPTQRFPAKAVTIVVPFPPGGSSDSAARIVGEKLSGIWGQPVIVENRPGAGTTIAATHVARASADGHTLFLVGPGTHGVSAALYRNLPYDAVKSFAGATQIAQAPFVFVVNAGSKVRSMNELIAFAKAQPGKITYSSSGNGAGPHLITERLAVAQGLKLVHVPYKGSAPATMAAMAGEVDFSLADTSAVPHIQSGKLRGLAVTSGERSTLFPDLPTLAEAGIDGIVYPLSVGLLAPAGTDPRTLDEIHRAVGIALADPGVSRSMRSLGFEIRTTTPRKFDDLLALEVRRYQEIVRSIGLKLE